MNYVFYFDETFHEHKVSVSSEGVLNVFTEQKNDSYIGVFLGYERKKELTVISRYNEIEQKYLNAYGISKEFKSTVISRKNFNHGVRSLNKNAFLFYKDMFAFLEEISPIIHVNMASKIELLVRNIFDIKMLRQVPFVIPNSFYYSMTKFIMNYHSPQLFKVLYDSVESGNNEVFRSELLRHLKRVIDEIKDIERKGRELPALEQLCFIVKNYKFNNAIKQKYDFVYFQNFDGLMNLLEEKNIVPNRVNVAIDKERDTYRVASRYNFNKVIQLNSTESIQIRIVDHLCGFIGRMMNALVEDETMKEDSIEDINLLGNNDLVRKRLLSPTWFSLNEEQFNLYKQITKVLLQQQEAYWATMTWSYADQACMFYTLLRYFYTFESFEEFNKYVPEQHSEFYNTACLEELERHFMDLC